MRIAYAVLHRELTALVCRVKGHSLSLKMEHRNRTKFDRVLSVVHQPPRPRSLKYNFIVSRRRNSPKCIKQRATRTLHLFGTSRETRKDSINFIERHERSRYFFSNAPRGKGDTANRVAFSSIPVLAESSRIQRLLR